MELGIALPTSGPLVSREAIVRVAQEAERLGYAAVWTYERLLYPLDGVVFPGTTQAVPLDEYYSKTFEPIETLAYVAAKTERVKLGTSIIDAPFHSPLVLARLFATLDQFSDGRVIAGLGQGWMEQEFNATNMTRKYQGPGINEFVAAMRAAWGENPVQFEGKYYNIARSNIDPKPIQQGGIPIIMGVATPSAIKRAARIADGLTPVASSLEALEGVVNSCLDLHQIVHLVGLQRSATSVEAPEWSQRPNWTAGWTTANPCFCFHSSCRRRSTALTSPLFLQAASS